MELINRRQVIDQ